ncbi:FecR domain-containing protein [Hwanghaeella sp.]|uniref:FecR domain-containing protein n=1 Tax=Hwanghaeella sp. TaxID=2605943 RepID=UPI003CCB7C4C
MPDIIIGEERETPAFSDPVQSEGVQIAQVQLAQAQVAPVQVAQGATSIGSVAKLTGQATIIRATGETVQAEIGTPVFQDDTFETGADSGVGLQFEDGSSFSLGSDARLTIDNFVYDAGGADSNMVMNLAQGAFSFVSGQVAKTGENNMTIVTPTATIGIRGTAGAGDDDEVVLLQEPGQQTGELTVTTQGGTVSLTSPNSYTNTSNPLAGPTTPTVQPLGAIQSRFGNALRDLPVTLPANQNLPNSNSNNGQNQGGPEAGPGGQENAPESGQDDADEGGDDGGDENADGAEGEEVPDEGPIDEEVLEGEGEEDGALDEGPADGDDLAGDGAPGEGPTDGANDEIAAADAGDTDFGGGDDAGDEGAEGDDGAEGGDGDDGGEDGGEGGDGASGDPGGAGDGGTQTANATGTTGGTPTGQTTTTTKPVAKKVTTSTDQNDVLNKQGFQNAGETQFKKAAGDSGGETGEVVNPSVEGQQEQLAGEEVGPEGPGDEGPINIEDEPPPENSTLPPPENTGGATVGTFALTAAADTVLFSTGPEVIQINGFAGAGDLFLDGGPGAPQFAVLETAGSHDFTVDGVENIFFNFTLNSNDTHNISIVGTTAVNFDAAGGSFNGNVTGDAANNTLTILDNSGIEEFLAVNFANTSGDTFTGNIDLQGGNDVIDFAGIGSDLDLQINVSNVETYIGSLANEDLTLQTALTVGDSFDGGGPGDVDVLNLLAGTNIGAILNFETINGSAAADTLTLENGQLATFGTFVDLGAGIDTLNLANDNNTLAIANTETINGGTGDDFLSMGSDTVDTIALGGGIDTVNASGQGTFTVTSMTGVENFIGASGIDTVTLFDQLLTGSFFDGSDVGGADVLNLADGVNDASIANFEFVFSFAAADSLTVENNLLAAFGTKIDLGAGVDDLTLADGGNDLSVENIETVIGGFGADIINLLDPLVTGDFYDGVGIGDGDVLNLVGGAHVGTITNFETINGVAANADSVTLETATAENQFFDLGNFGDGDILTLANGINVIEVADIDNLVGGAGDDDVTISSQLVGNLDMGGGIDIIDASSQIQFTNTGFTGVEIFTGSSGIDTVTLFDNLFAGSVYDGSDIGGTNILNLFDGVNTAAIFNFSDINGTAAADDLTLESNLIASNNTFIDLAGGADNLFLADGGNEFTIQGVEDVSGGFGNDVITVLNAGGGVVIADTSTGDFDHVINGDGGTGVFGLSNIEQFTGGISFDTIAMNGDIFAGSIYDGGGVADGDILNLAFGSNNTGTIVNFETIAGVGGNETLTFEAPVGGSPILIDMGTGFDVVTLADGGNSATFLNTTIIHGGIGDDQVILDDTLTTDVLLGAGLDEVVLNLNGGTYSFSAFSGVELLTGVEGGPFEDVTLNDAQIGLDIDLGLFGDGDSVTLASGLANSVRIFDLNNLIGGIGDDSVELGTTNAGLITLGGGIDVVDASNVAGSIINTLIDVEQFIGSAGTDDVTLGSLLTAGALYSGGADGDSDILQLFDGINTADIAHFETILGSVSNDSLFLEGDILASFGTTIDLGAGIDDLTLSNGANELAVFNVENLNGGAGNDTVELLNDIVSGDVFNGQAGFDILKLLSVSTNQGTVLDFEEVRGFDGTAESLVLETNSATNTLFDLGLAGDGDSLTLLDGGNTIAIQDLDLLIGGLGDDIVTVQGNVAAGSNYDGGGASADSDDLILQDGTTVSATILDFETISANTTTGIALTLENGGGFFGDIVFSGAGVDSVTMLGLPNNTRISGIENFTGGTGGGDTVELLTGGDTVNFAEVDVIIGSAGNDTINIIDTTSADITLGLGDDTATGATGVADFYIFTAVGDALADGIGNGAETITNFEVGVDNLDITAFALGNFFYNGAGALTGGGTASSRFDTANETLEIDVDGDTVVDMEIVMNGVTDATLSSADFSF